MMALFLQMSSAIEEQLTSRCLTWWDDRDRRKRSHAVSAGAPTRQKRGRRQPGEKLCCLSVDLETAGILNAAAASRYQLCISHQLTSSPEGSPHLLLHRLHLLPPSLPLRPFSSSSNFSSFFLLCSPAGFTPLHLIPSFVNAPFLLLPPP